MHFYVLIAQAVSSFQIAIKGIKGANSDEDHGTLPLGLTGFCGFTPSFIKKKTVKKGHV